MEDGGARRAVGAVIWRIEGAARGGCMVVHGGGRDAKGGETCCTIRDVFMVKRGRDRDILIFMVSAMTVFAGRSDRQGR
jgi:hypothetical protein